MERESQGSGAHRAAHSGGVEPGVRRFSVVALDLDDRRAGLGNAETAAEATGETEIVLDVAELVWEPLQE